MTVTGEKDWTVRGMWKNFPLKASHVWFLQSTVWHCYGGEGLHVITCQIS